MTSVIASLIFGLFLGLGMALFPRVRDLPSPVRLGIVALIFVLGVIGMYQVYASQFEGKDPAWAWVVVLYPLGMAIATSTIGLIGYAIGYLGSKLLVRPSNWDSGKVEK